MKLTNEQFLEQVDRVLESGDSLSIHARKLGYRNENSVYQRLYRLGYKIESARKRVPICTQSDCTQLA